MILLDTHIWFWFLEDSAELRGELKSHIEGSPDQVLLSAISVWELLVLARKKKLALRPSPEKYVRDALTAYPFQVAWLTAEISILSETLAFEHSDPADRFIAATAYAHQSELATDDVNLRKLSWLSCR